MRNQKISRYCFSENQLSQEFDNFFRDYAAAVLRDGRLLDTNAYIQHGTTSCYSHSISVAYYSLLFAVRLGINCDFESLVIGALLHDYFLYDWHCKDLSHRLHGFRHPKTALENALQDFDLNTVEQDIIMKHMFPLTPIPPKYRESLIVCLTDKFCSIAETMHINVLPSAIIQDVQPDSETGNDNID